MNTPETLTLAQFLDKNPEEQKLYREVWRARHKRPYRNEPNPWETERYTERYVDYEDYKNCLTHGYETRQQFERIRDEKPKTFCLDLMEKGHFYLTIENGILNFSTPKGSFRLSPEKVSELRKFIDNTPAPPVETVEQAVVYNDVKYPDMPTAIWDCHSRAMPEDTYDVEAEYAHVAGKNIMLEADFKEGVAHLQALLSSQQREIEELREQLHRADKTIEKVLNTVSGESMLSDSHRLQLATDRINTHLKFKNKL